MTSVDLLDWWRLGLELRLAAFDCWGRLLHPQDAYQFMVHNPECFGYQNWPAGMPKSPPLELIAAYLESPR